jgi:hypothetical protein
VSRQIAFENALENCTGKGMIRAVFGNDLYPQIRRICDFTGARSAQDLIHGQDGKIAMNAREKKLREPIDKVLTNQLPDRVADLERRVADLENDVALLKSLSNSPVFAGEVEGVEKKKPGPKKKIDDQDLFRYRHELIIWLEPVWPWMEDRLLRATTLEEVRAVLEAVAEVPEFRPDHQERLLKNAVALLEFLWDERFGKTPLPRATVTDALTLPWDDARRRRACNQLPTRQIANAMAGVPEIVWRTSLDRCSAQPSAAFVALNLDMHYRDRFGIPAPADRDLTGASVPEPKPLQPISAQPSVQPAAASNAPIKTTAAAN